MVLSATSSQWLSGPVTAFGIWPALRGLQFCIHGLVLLEAQYDSRCRSTTSMSNLRKAVDGLPPAINRHGHWEVSQFKFMDGLHA